MPVVFSSFSSSQANRIRTPISNRSMGVSEMNVWTNTGSPAYATLKSSSKAGVVNTMRSDRKNLWAV